MQFIKKKTKAYVELSSNPLMETFFKVVRLLNDLNSKKQIRVWQYSRMMPKKENVKLAYLYFISKSHNVTVFARECTVYLCSVYIFM